MSASPIPNEGDLSGLRAIDRAVLFALQQEGWSSDLFGLYGYPSDQAIEKITKLLGRWNDEDEDGAALVDTYYSLKFLKSVGLVGDRGVDGEAFDGYRKTGKFATQGGIFSLTDVLMGNATPKPVPKLDKLPSDRVIERAISLSVARESTNKEHSFTREDFAHVIKPLIAAYELFAKAVDPIVSARFLEKGSYGLWKQAPGDTWQKASDWFRQMLSENERYDRAQLQVVQKVLIEDLQTMGNFYDRTQDKNPSPGELRRQLEERIVEPVIVEPMTAHEVEKADDPEPAPHAATQDEPFRTFGLIGELASSLSDKVPVEYLFADLVVRFGAECRGNLLMDTGDGLVPARQFMVLVDGSGVGKSRSAAIVVNFFAECNGSNLNKPDELCIIDGAGSDRYVYEMLQENHDVLLNLDELDLLISKSEISGSMLLQAVTSLYSKTDFRSGTKKEKIEVAGGRLSLRAGCTAATFDTVAGGRALRLGFVNRLWVVRAGERPLVGTNNPAKAQHLRHTFLRTIPSERTVICFDAEGRQLFERWKTDLPKDEIAKRLDEISYRLMPVLVVTSGKQFADREVVEYTAWLMNRQYEHRLTVFPVDGKNQMAMVENKIRRVVSKLRTVSTKELRKRVQGHSEGEFYFQSALRNVEKSGDIQIEGTLVSWAAGTDFSPDQASVDTIRYEAQKAGGISADRLHTLLSGKTKAERARLAGAAGLKPKKVKIPGICRPIEMWVPERSE